MTGHPGPAEILADKTESAGMFDSLGRYADRLYVMTLNFVFNEIATTYFNPQFAVEMKIDNI